MTLDYPVMLLADFRGKSQHHQVAQRPAARGLGFWRPPCERMRPWRPNLHASVRVAPSSYLVYC